MTYHWVCHWRNTTGAASGAPEFIPVFNEVRVTRSLVSCVCLFCRSLFVLSFIYSWLLCCLSFDLPILITPLFDIFKLFFKQVLNTKNAHFQLEIAHRSMLHLLPLFMPWKSFVLNRRRTINEIFKSEGNIIFFIFQNSRSYYYFPDRGLLLTR